MSISFGDLAQLPRRTLKRNKDVSNPIFHCQIKESATRPPTHPPRLRVHGAANSMAGAHPAISFCSPLSLSGGTDSTCCTGASAIICNQRRSHLCNLLARARSIRAAAPGTNHENLGRHAAGAPKSGNQSH
jgi:hypothetical protein